MAGRSGRLLPPAALLAGVLLFAVGLLVLNLESAGLDPQPLDPAVFTSENGTAVLAYPTWYYGIGSSRLLVSYAFPLAPGEAYYVDCRDLDSMRHGHAPAQPLMAFTDLREGSFVVSQRTLPDAAGPYVIVDSASGLPRQCDPAIAFQWTVGDQAPEANRPTATVAFNHRPFDQGNYGLLLAIMGAGAVLALAGGLAWARTRLQGTGVPSQEQGPLEVLRALLERMGAQLERTRRHLFLAGALGVLLWYPILVPWAWRQADRTTESPVFPWAVGGIVLAFLAILTALWIKELHRLDRELAAWRTRLAELRTREAHLMDTL
ncbi:MAG TPA: hypothetical protein VM286_08825 [Candidatus Thermoplasmatota archaeon]|nr:hypothetical protein [Candidatus Thermoplasmatota archaeon]